MKTSRTVIVAILSFILGGVVGRYVAAHRFRAALNECIVISAAGSADAALVALNRLSRGDTNAAIKSLDLYLDGQLLGLQSMLDDMPESRLKMSLVRTVERARAYRAAHPTDTAALEESK